MHIQGVVHWQTPNQGKNVTLYIGYYRLLQGGVIENLCSESALPDGKEERFIQFAVARQLALLFSISDFPPQYLYTTTPRKGKTSLALVTQEV
jgi:hypothetical protein